MLCVSIGSAALDKLQRGFVRLSQKLDREGALAVLQALPQSEEALGMTSEPHGSVWVSKLAPEKTGFPAGHRRHRDLIGDAHRAQADPARRINIPVRSGLQGRVLTRALVFLQGAHKQLPVRHLEDQRWVRVDGAV